MQKRWLPRSMGRANRIHRRTSHVTVVVDATE
jgi:ribosomal protein L22